MRVLFVRLTYLTGVVILLFAQNCSSLKSSASSPMSYTVFLPITVTSPEFGVLEPTPEHAANALKAGLQLRTLEIGWNLYEPQENAWDPTYIDTQRAALGKMTNAGFRVILDLGVQYPPSWILRYPHSHFVNQYGDTFDAGLGINGLNAIFNADVRVRVANYVERVFADLGTSFYAVRLGWGPYNELMYPTPSYNGRTNAYWAYDALAQGQLAGLPQGMQPAPLPGWKPGDPSTDHTAATFLNWYLDSLKNYHDWQIAVVRRSYQGTLLMLYPDWGIRPGQLDAAIATNLNGTTSAEINGVIPRGLDFARFVGGITDRNVAAYTTWLEASNDGDNDSDPRAWSPVHFLAALTAANPVHPGVWGENSGRNDYAEMQRCVWQVHTYQLHGMLWAFETDLYTSQTATLTRYAALIGRQIP